MTDKQENKLSMWFSTQKVANSTIRYGAKCLLSGFKYEIREIKTLLIWWSFFLINNLFTKKVVKCTDNFVC